MPKLSIDGAQVSYEVLDCKDKVILIKVPYVILNNVGSMYSQIKTISKKLREDCGAKKIITIANDIDFESLDLKDAINKIDDYINQLYKIREELL